MAWGMGWLVALTEGSPGGKRVRRFENASVISVNVNVADVWRKIGCTTECYVLSSLLLVIREEPR